MRKLSPSPYCSAAPPVGPPLTPSNTALAELAALVRSCHPPSRVKKNSPASEEGAASSIAPAATQARATTRGFASIFMKRMSFLAVEAEAGERDGGAEETVAERIVTARGTEVLGRRLDRSLDGGGIGDALAIEQCGQRRDVGRGLARAHDEEVPKVVVPAGLRGGVGVERLLQDAVRVEVGAQAGAGVVAADVAAGSHEVERGPEVRVRRTLLAAVDGPDRHHVGLVGGEADVPLAVVARGG